MSILTAERFPLPVARICINYLIEDAESILGFMAALEEENGSAYSFATYVIQTVLPSRVPKQHKERFIKATLLYALGKSDLDLAGRCLASFNNESEPNTRLFVFKEEARAHSTRPQELHALKNLCGGCRLEALSLFPNLEWPSNLIPLLDSLDQTSFVTQALSDESLIPADHYSDAVYTLAVAAICRGITQLQLPASRILTKKKAPNEVQTQLDNILTITNINMRFVAPGFTTQAAAIENFFRSMGNYTSYSDLFATLAACADSASVKMLMSDSNIPWNPNPRKTLNMAASYGSAEVVQTLLTNDIFQNAINWESIQYAAYSQNTIILQSFVSLNFSYILSSSLVMEMEKAVRQGNSETLRHLMTLSAFASVRGDDLAQLAEQAAQLDYVAVTFLLINAPQFPKDKIYNLLTQTRSLCTYKMLVEHPLFENLTSDQFGDLLITRSIKNVKIYELLVTHPFYKKIDPLYIGASILQMRHLELIEKSGRLSEMNPKYVVSSITANIYMSNKKPVETSGRIALATALFKIPPFEKISAEKLTEVFAKVTRAKDPKWIELFTQSPRFSEIDLTKIGERVVDLARKGAVDKLTLLLAHPHTKRISPLFIEEALKATQDPTIAALLTSIQKSK